MSHSVTIHAKHAEHIPHDHHLGIHALTGQYVQALRDAGHDVTHHHVHRHEPHEAKE